MFNTTVLANGLGCEWPCMGNLETRKEKYGYNSYGYSTLCSSTCGLHFKWWLKEPRRPQCPYKTSCNSNSASLLTAQHSLHFLNRLDTGPRSLIHSLDLNSLALTYTHEKLVSLVFFYSGVIINLTHCLLLFPLCRAGKKINNGIIGTVPLSS